VYSDNMGRRSDPEVKRTRAKSDWTRITFTPDLARFGMASLDADTVALLTKRVYDMAGCTDKSVRVHLNGEELAVRGFKEYAALYRQEGEPALAHERVNDRWEVAVGASDGAFQHVSFVNSICTSKGGTHLDLVVNQLVRRLQETAQKKHKGVAVKPAQVKGHLSVFVNCLIENPAFSSQTKECLTSKASAFGSKCELNDRLARHLVACGVVDSMLSWARVKACNDLKRQHDGRKRGRLLGIPKLDDANNAGGRHAQRCSLILTEGDSAKALAVSGLAVLGRDDYGVFPLKGKLLNVRDASPKQVMENQEIQHITSIMGLQHGKEYADTSSLRYGHIMIMADQDHDGSHIKGLVINLIAHFWPSLLKIPGFLQEFVTPIVKVSRRGEPTRAFFTQTEYAAWRAAHDEGRGWRMKYYKGLGTSTAAEAKEYFADLRLHRLDFEYSGPHNEADLDMAFNKKRPDDRKEWLTRFDPAVFVDHARESVDLSDFVHNELIHFSMADNHRSIPAMTDGLKPGQRKILWACFLRNLRTEIKVAQLAGYVSEHAAYHHGEASLCGAIINMAQDFPGSNNINLLTPNGQFGTRIQGGKDAASPRYVFTQLNKVAWALFPAADDAVLPHLTDDGLQVEPERYVPLIPLSLVNGADGIGTGWSSSAPCYNPRDVIDNLRRLLAGEPPVPMLPWYRGHTGVIEPKADDPSCFYSFGVIRVVDAVTVEISELPVKRWTQDYKEFLEASIEGEGKRGGFIRDFRGYHTDSSVRFVVTLSEEQLAQAQREGLHQKFKLVGTINTGNVHLFNSAGRIQKYGSPAEVLAEFYAVRIETTARRKAHLLEQLEREWARLDDRVRFIRMVVEEELVVAKRPRAELLAELEALGFRQFGREGAGPGGYDYLLGMPMWSLTTEKMAELEAEAAAKREALAALRAKTAEDLYGEDLDGLSRALDEFDAARPVAAASPGGKKPPAKANKSRKRAADPPAGSGTLVVPVQPAPRKPKRKGSPAAGAPAAVASPPTAVGAGATSAPTAAPVAPVPPEAAAAEPPQGDPPSPQPAHAGSPPPLKKRLLARIGEDTALQGVCARVSANAPAAASGGTQAQSNPPSPEAEETPAVSP
jgi:DNA topoisomerase-2